jgi:hypothetical protein
MLEKMNVARDSSAPIVPDELEKFMAKGYLYVANAGNQRIQKFEIPEP